MELRFLNVKMTSSIFLVLILSNHEGDTTSDGEFGQRGKISPRDSYHDLWTMWKKVYGKENFSEEVRNKNWVSNYHKVRSPSFKCRVNALFLAPFHLLISTTLNKTGTSKVGAQLKAKKAQS